MIKKIIKEITELKKIMSECLINHNESLKVYTFTEQLEKFDKIIKDLEEIK